MKNNNSDSQERDDSAERLSSRIEGFIIGRENIASGQRAEVVAGVPLPEDVIPLYRQVYDMDNLEAAWNEIKKNKRKSDSFQTFALFKDEILLQAQNELIWFLYDPKKRGVNHFFIREPKLREINAPKHYDKLIHHALIRVVLPVFESVFHPNSFACRKGKGTHPSCIYYQKMIKWALADFGKDFVIVSVDFKLFFALIDHEVTKELIRCIFDDPGILWLTDSIVDALGDIGLPLGFLPSQHLSGLIGTVVDIFVTRFLGVSDKRYIRTADDIRIICRTKEEAKDIIWHLDEFCWERLKITLSPKKTKIQKWSGRDTWCGYIIAPHHFEPKKSTKRRAEKRIAKKTKLVQQGKLSPENLEASKRCHEAYLSHTYKKAKPRRKKRNKKIRKKESIERA
ncbi:MAG: reverse transcriptase domain-containing protein [Candidatus Cryptobacteroides sp.]